MLLSLSDKVCGIHFTSMKKQTIGRSDVVVKKYMLQSTIIMLR